MKHDSFAEKVYGAVRKIPKGYVSTYGRIAEMIGSPGAARAVGNALHKNPDGEATPCYRVVSSTGRLTPQFVFGGSREQKKRLMADGIEVHGIRVDLKKYLWREQ